MIRDYEYLPVIEENFRTYIGRLYGDHSIKGITFQITEDCCLSCTYCYQHAKTKQKMDFNLIKKTIDLLLDDKNEYINTSNTKGLIIEFIGGEPLLESKLIKDTIEYYLTQVIIKHHPWAFFTKFGICSNGVLYFNNDFQDMLKKYSNFIGFTVSIDGNKKLHDSCRIDLQGNGSYDKAIAAVEHYRKYYNKEISTKMTLSPDNIEFFYESIIDLIQNGYKQIWVNCVFENVWDISHAQLVYQELKKIANYLIDNNLYDKVFVRMLDERLGTPMDEQDNKNFCGGCLDNSIDNMALNYKGEIYPCVRYMESSLNQKQKPLYFGTIQNGILETNEEKENQKILSNITRRSQSTDECFYCPVAFGCSWCSAFNYEEFGTPNKRATYICYMHKASVLASVYYWNLIYKKLKINKNKILYLPKEECLKIISENEYNFLSNLIK